jgi:glutamate/tyrosine decarboxylase-like PLP-dependent enzyme
MPSAIAADWLTSAWDQNAGSTEGTPAAAAFEQVALRWVVELLRLPTGASTALVTGAQMANTVGLAAARNALFEAVGWDVEARGLAGAPPMHVVVGEERHDTVARSLRLLGLGCETARLVRSDANGRMIPAELEAALESLDGPAIVCAQVGNVNTGGVDRVGEIATTVERRRSRGRPTWLHVDGAFGLWARASKALAPIVEGVDRADSWATDGHKWPNVPYDCGVAIVAHPRRTGAQWRFTLRICPRAPTAICETHSTGRPSSRGGRAGSRSTLRSWSSERAASRSSSIAPVRSHVSLLSASERSRASRY